MKRLIAALLSAAFVSVGLVGSLAAQEPDTDDARAVVVSFETFDVEDQLLEDFYGHIEDVLEQREGLTVGEVGNVEMDELLLMAGCNEPTPDCLAAIGDIVEGERLVFGSIERSDDVLMFSMSLFDLENQTMVREITEQTLRGDGDWIAKGMPAIVEHLVYGETATVNVDVQAAPEADIRVNGDSVGTGSTEVDDVTPGEVVVIARPPEGEEQQERFIIRHGDQRDVEFQFDSGVDDIDTPRAETPSLVPGLAVGGAGVAGTVVGMVGQIQLASANAEAESLVGGRSAVSPDQRAQVDELQSRMTSANTMRWVGFGAGVVGLAGGGYLLYRALSAETTAHDQPGGADVAVDLGASDNGVHAGFRMRF